MAKKTFIAAVTIYIAFFLLIICLFSHNHILFALCVPIISLIMITFSLVPSSYCSLFINLHKKMKPNNTCQTLMFFILFTAFSSIYFAFDWQSLWGKSNNIDLKNYLLFWIGSVWLGCIFTATAERINEIKSNSKRKQVLNH